jgi:Peptidase C39 family
MDPTVSWFVSIASLSSLAWAGGYYMGRRSAGHARAVLLIGLASMGTWLWLHYNPAVAVRVIPLSILSQIEGVGNVPFFMLLLGLAWARSQRARQKRLVLWAVVLGIVFFVNGGLWMLQSTPEQSFAGTPAGGPGADEPVRQSEEYSCVPAACAQVLDLLGIPTSERQMARLTQTRPGTGATTLRAMQGLSQRLQGTGYTVELLEFKVSELRSLPCPALTPLQYESTIKHMVTVTAVTPIGLQIIDPIDGPMLLGWKTLETVFTGEVLVFDRR